MELTCATCSKTFDRPKSNIRPGTERHYCSRGCRAAEPVRLMCEVCASAYSRKPSEASRSRWCSYHCAGIAHVAMRDLNGIKPGERRSRQTEFKAGDRPANALPVGSVTIRTRHKRGGEQRAWVKVAEPNVWRERYRVVWEAANGPVPRGCVVHHVDHDPLNDTLANLALMTRAEHAAHHNSV